MTMSAPWSVRERAFSRKLSLKHSICRRIVGKKNGEEGKGKKIEREEKRGGGDVVGRGEWDEEGRGTAELDACKIRSQKMMVQSGAWTADMMNTAQIQIHLMRNTHYFCSLLDFRCFVATVARRASLGSFLCITS